MLPPAFSAADVVAATHAASLSDVVDGILDVVARLLATRLAVVSRIESTTYTVMAVVDQHHMLRQGQMLNLQDTFCVHMLEAGQPLVIDDMLEASGALRMVPGADELNIRAYAGVPLYMADGRVFGTLWVADSQPRIFGPQDVALLQLFARLLTHEIDQDVQSRHSERIEQVRSMHNNIDPLTGLLGRDSFEAALSREVARNKRHGGVYAVAVLLMSPNNQSHDRSDAHSNDILRQGLADLLMRTSRLIDCCARIDTDEFAVLFAETTSSGVQTWSQRITAAIDAWNRVHGANDLRLAVQVGVMDHRDLTQHEPSCKVLALARSRAVEQPIMS